MSDSQELFFRLEPIDPANKPISESVLDDDDEPITLKVYPGLDQGTYMYERDDNNDTTKSFEAASPEEAVEAMRRKFAADGMRLVEMSNE